ncbi:MAG: purine/pyrimidine permease [Clostridia bacterium]|nr:purine/pyrimidine permease [Clostridia bacterium]
MKFKYGVNERLGVLPALLYGVQWLAVSVPITIILGKTLAVTFAKPELVIYYLQKLFLVTGLTMGIQILWGHRLPLLTGPATVLLIGILAGLEAGMGAINGAIIINGALLTLLAVTGLFDSVKKLFTPRVVVTILLLVAVTLTPTIIRLMVPAGTLNPAKNYIFALSLVFLLFIAHGMLKGIWRSTISVWAALLGSFAYFAVFGLERGMEVLPAFASPFGEPWMVTLPNIGVMFSFLVCMLALSINDLGSIQAVGALTEADEMGKRATRGLAITGLGNVLSGFLGVIGQVNFSLSSGVVLASGCASRFALLPTAAALLLIGCSPSIIGLLSSIPLPVVAAIMMYIASAQISSGLLMAQNANAVSRVEDGLVVGLPVILSIVVVFLPQEVVAQLPLLLRPILTNGFVMGTLAVFLFEHLIYRK